MLNVVSRQYFHTMLILNLMMMRCVPNPPCQIPWDARRKQKEEG